MNAAIRNKSVLLAEYFIKLCMYMDNGVSVYYEKRSYINKLKTNDFLFVKHRHRMPNDSMVYLLDKHIEHAMLKLNIAPLSWYASYLYDRDKYITCDLEYDISGNPKSTLLELVNNVTNEIISLHVGENIVFYSDKDEVMGFSQFFDEFEDKVKLYKRKNNFYVLDDFDRDFAERLGAPEIHVPLDDDLDLDLN